MQLKITYPRAIDGALILSLLTPSFVVLRSVTLTVWDMDYNLKMF